MQLMEILRESQLSDLPEKLKTMNVKIKGKLSDAYAAALNIAYNKDNIDENDKEVSVATEGNVINSALFNKLQDSLATKSTKGTTYIYTISADDINHDVYTELVNDVQRSSNVDEFIMVVNKDAIEYGEQDETRVALLRAMETYINIVDGNVIWYGD